MKDYSISLLVAMITTYHAHLDFQFHLDRPKLWVMLNGLATTMMCYGMRRMFPKTFVLWNNQQQEWVCNRSEQGTGVLFFFFGYGSTSFVGRGEMGNQNMHNNVIMYIPQVCCCQLHSFAKSLNLPQMPPEQLAKKLIPEKRRAPQHHDVGSPSFCQPNPRFVFVFCYSVQSRFARKTVLILKQIFGGM